MVTIDRDVPGQSASVWKSPIPRAVRKDIAVRSFSPRPSRRPSQIIHTPPAASAASTGPGLKSAALIALLSSTPARAAGTKASATFQASRMPPASRPRSPRTIWTTRGQ